MKIGIIGLGVVGTAVKEGFKEHEIFTYDKFKNSNTIEEVTDNSELIFVSVPTPSNKQGIDLSAVNKTIELLNKLNYTGLIVLKSTVPPGTTDSYKKKYPNLKLSHNPEFLTEKNAINDFQNPDRIIIGYYNEEDIKSFKEIHKKFDCPLMETIPKVSEMIKYTANSFLATKVIFANQVYDYCKKLDIDYNEVKKGVLLDNRIGKTHFDVTEERGYGGMCFPKDVYAFIKSAKKQGIKLDLLKKVHEINQKIRKN